MKQAKVKWHAVFFDFDGVIADSVEVKTQAFRAMFKQFGKEVEEAVIQYHLAHGGMPRFEKIRYFYTSIVGQPLTDDSLERLGSEFSSLVLDKVVAAPLKKGVLETLQQLQQSATKAFVVSGTPHEEMNCIVKRKQLNDYFFEVHGSPRSKTVIVEDILQRFSLMPEQCIFIGDAMADYTAAQNTGMHFLGITTPGQPLFFPAGVQVASQVNLPREKNCLPDMDILKRDRSEGR